MPLIDKRGRAVNPRVASAPGRRFPYDFGAVREVRSSSFLRDTRSHLPEGFGRKARGRVGINPAGGRDRILPVDDSLLFPDLSFTWTTSLSNPSYSSPRPKMTGIKAALRNSFGDPKWFGSQGLLEGLLSRPSWFLCYPILRTFAAAGPFCPLTTSNSTLWPSDKDLKPSP